LPFNIVGKLSGVGVDFIRSLNFFLVVAWIISFLLAYRDDS